MGKLSKLSEWWGKASRPKRLSLISVVFLFFATVGYLLVFEPYWEYYSELKEDYERQRLLYEKYRSKAAKLEELKKRKIEVDESFERLKGKFFTEKTETLAFSVFKDSISAKAKRSGVVEEGVSKRPGNELMSGVKKLRLRGRYNSRDLRNLLEFMFSVEKGEEKITGFESVDIILDRYKGRETYYLSAEIFGLWIR